MRLKRSDLPSDVKDLDERLAVIRRDKREAVQAQQYERAAIVVCESRPPYRGIEVQGEARLAASGGATRRIATRYLGERGGAAYAQTAEDDTLIRLEPRRLRGWDFADEYGPTPDF